MSQICMCQVLLCVTCSVIKYFENYLFDIDTGTVQVVKTHINLQIYFYYYSNIKYD